MSSRSGFVFRWRSESGQLQADFNTIVAQTKRVSRALLQMGQTQAARGLAANFDDISKKIQFAQVAVERLKAALSEIEKFQKGRTANVPIPGEETRGLAGLDPSRTRFTMEESVEAASRLQQQITAIESLIGGWNDDLQQFNAGLIQAQQLTVAVGEGLGDRAFQRRVDRASSGESLDLAVQERINQLEQTRLALLEKQAKLRQQVFENLDPTGQARAQEQIASLRAREARSAQQVADIQSARLAVEQRLNALGSQRVNQFLDLVRQGRNVDEAKGILPSVTSQQQQDIRRFIDLTRQLQEAQAKLLETGRQAAKPEGGFAFVANRLGVGDDLTRITTQLGQIDREIAGFSGPGRLDEMAKIAPKLFTQIQRLAEVSSKYRQVQNEMANAASLTSKQFESLQRRAETLSRLQTNLTAAVERGTRAIAQQGVLKPFKLEDIQAQLGTLERTLIGAFRGFGKRFQATLQFSLSAGLIFGTQRFLREFFQTAVEVERAFEDIATALEFDITAPRGSAEFRRELESIRLAVLDIADEFNVLPTVANEVAFKMVARFQDMGNAVEATRQQLLALKISTIDQEEVLRSLTATAEAFANEVLIVNSNLTLQERLLARENAAVLNYARAVDLATVIQQKWGVDFEDTIEGVARAGPTFQSLGFTMQETAAIVASATRVLPGTGVQIAERLVRAFGSFNTGEIREELLALADSTEHLTLTMADFEVSGKNALEVIQSQVDQLAKFDPAALVELQQIIGQRRELEVVSAVLGTADLQADINAISDAAGAAERRFAFLEQTTTELIASMVTQFQEFAQNLERIGILDPFKLLIRGAGLALDTINSLLRGILSLIEALNKIPFVGFDGLGDALTTILAIGVALRSALKTLEAIGVAQGALGLQGLAGMVTGSAAAGLVDPRSGQPFGSQNLTAAQTGIALFSKGLVRVSELFLRLGRGLGRALTGMREFVSSVIASRGAILKNIAAIIAETRQRIASAGAGLRQGFINAGGSAAGLRALGIGAAVVGVSAALLSLRSSLEESRNSFREHTESVKESRRRIESEAAARGLDPDETRLEQLRAELEIARNRQDVGGFGNILQGLLGNLFTGGAEGTRVQENLAQSLDDSEFLRALLEFNGIATAGMGAQELRDAARELVSGLTFDVRQVIPGSAERNQIEAAGTAQRFAAALQEEFLKAFENLPAGVQREGLDIARSSDILRRIQQAGTPEEALALLDELLDWEADWNLFKDKHNLTLVGVEGTIKQMQEAVKRIAGRVDIGEISPAQGLSQVQEQIDKAQALLDTVTDSREREVIEDGIREFKQKQGELIRTQLEDARALANATLSEEGAIRANIAALERTVAEYEQTGNKRAADQARLEIIEAQKSLNQFIFNQIQSQAQIAESLAGSPEETLRILREQKKELQRFLLKKLAETLIAQLARGIFAGGADFGFIKEILDAINQVQKRIEDITGDLNVRRAVAQGRRSGPILSNIARLKAEAAGLRERAKQVAKGTVEAMELVNSINENLANQALEQLRAAQAYVLLQAGVNDVLAQTRAELTNVSREITLAAQLYGSQSAEVFELKKRQETLKAALIAYELELRDLNRRLDATDLTNTLETAELELIRIAEALTAPDLGPLEKARLELEKRQAELAHERAFFDDRLFELQFAFETGAIGTSAYIAALQRLLSEVDTSTRQGKEIFLEIQGLIDSLSDDITDMQFNVPSSIRLPTIFEIRRSLAADQLGVNYVDNRQQSITIEASDALSLEEILQAVVDSIDSGATRTTAGAAGITIGAFL
jgi:hypothetical protein